jgi:hypothetical protein
MYRYFRVFCFGICKTGNVDACSIECDSVEGAGSEGQPSHPFSYHETAVLANDNYEINARGWSHSYISIHYYSSVGSCCTVKPTNTFTHINPSIWTYSTILPKLPSTSSLL